MSPRVGHHRNRCKTCSMREVLCLCEEQPKIDISTHVTFVMHYLEAKTTTNTARLACVGLTHANIILRGLPGSSLDEYSILKSEMHPLLMFPYDDAQELTPNFVSTLKRPIQLIVPDGTWRQASKAARRIPELKSVQKVKLPAGGALSAYQLRTESRDENVCTFEAVARALGILDDRDKVQIPLEHLFHLMVDRTLWSQGKKKPEDCYGGIPEIAIQESWNGRTSHS